VRAPEHPGNLQPPVAGVRVVEQVDVDVIGPKPRQILVQEFFNTFLGF
jgi:hypothetical protein